MRKYLLLLVLCALTATSAALYAQVGRLLPEKGERGITGVAQPLPVVKIGSRLLRLAPGGVVYDRQNRFIVHSQIPVNAEVFYVRDQAGDIQKMYILTETEKALLTRAGKR